VSLVVEEHREQFFAEVGQLVNRPINEEQEYNEVISNT
jgi:hypothetical protein